MTEQYGVRYRSTQKIEVQNGKTGVIVRFKRGGVNSHHRGRRRRVYANLSCGSMGLSRCYRRITPIMFRLWLPACASCDEEITAISRLHHRVTGKSNTTTLCYVDKIHPWKHYWINLCYVRNAVIVRKCCT